MQQQFISLLRQIFCIFRCSYPQHMWIIIDNPPFLCYCYSSNKKKEPVLPNQLLNKRYPPLGSAKTSERSRSTHQIQTAPNGAYRLCIIIIYLNARYVKSLRYFEDIFYPSGV